jgi:hypothetical protein
MRYLRQVINHPLILAAAVTALLILCVSYVMLSVPLFASLETRVSIANGLALGGLGFSLVGWVSALILSLHRPVVPHWGWFLTLLLGGILFYVPAILESDFLSYILVGILPALYGLFGPLPARNQRPDSSPKKVMQ